MKTWIYKDIPISDISQFPPETYGFIYKIINDTTGWFYVGRKVLFFERKIALGKKELAALEDKRSSKKKIVIKESDWKTYMGTQENLAKDVKLYGEDNFSRIILDICKTKKSMTYQELRWQILEGCLESDKCYCDNILGKFYRRDLL